MIRQVYWQRNPYKNEYLKCTRRFLFSSLWKSTDTTVTGFVVIVYVKYKGENKRAGLPFTSFFPSKQINIRRSHLSNV